MRWHKHPGKRAAKGSKLPQYDSRRPDPPKVERPPPGPPRCITCGAPVVWERIGGGLVAYDARVGMGRAINRRHLRGLGVPLLLLTGRLHAKTCKRRPVEPAEPITLTDPWGLPWRPLPKDGEPMHLDKIRDRLVLVLDTETTGIDPATSRVCELGAVYFWRGQMVGRPLNIRINPGEPIPPGASAVHGITDAMVADAPTFAQVAPRMLAHLSGEWAEDHLRATGVADDGRTDPPLVAGYNIVRYDAPLLDAELERAGHQRVLVHGCDIIDPYLFARWYHPDKPLKLTELCEAFGVPLANAHAAWADAAATGHLLYRLLADAENERGPVPGFIPATIADPVGTSSFYETPGLDSPCAVGRQFAIQQRIEAERAEFGHYFCRDRSGSGEVLVAFGKHKGKQARNVPKSYWSMMLKYDDIHEGAARMMVALGGKTPRPLGAYGEPAPTEPPATTTQAAHRAELLDEAPW